METRMESYGENRWNPGGILVGNCVENGKNTVVKESCRESWWETGGILVGNWISGGILVKRAKTARNQKMPINRAREPSRV